MSAPYPGRRDCESLNDYIRRLEKFADTHMLRVPSGVLSSNELFIQPVVIYGTDEGGTPHEAFDDGGLLRSGSWPGGRPQSIQGSYTDTTGGDTTGRIDINPGVGDELIFLRGRMTVGGAKLTAGVCLVSIYDAGLSANSQMNLVGDVGVAAANEQWQFPSIGTQANATANFPQLTGFPALYMQNGDGILASLTNMANTETFAFYAMFLSKNNVEPVVTPTGGTWA